MDDRNIIKLEGVSGSQGDTGDLPISMLSMMTSLSTALDLINPALDSHHKDVCYIACCLAQELGCPDDQYNDLFAASILHDIGGLTLADRLKVLDFEVKTPHLHAELGYILLSKFPPFSNFAELVRYHHVPWDHGRGTIYNGQKVPLQSHLIHLADRVAVLINKKKPIFPQVPEIRDRIDGLSGAMFEPSMVEAFMEVSRREVFWLDLTLGAMAQALEKMSRLPDMKLGLDDLIRFSRFYALIIDTRSRFTATHSGGVAATAEVLGQLHGLSAQVCKKLKIAGYLHDIGKLAVPETILEKPGELSMEEWQTMRAHTYYTRRILEQVDGLGEITDWAADHHESLVGNGYPFRRNDEKLRLGSRILAVADVFTALSEDRPYRKGMASERIIQIIGGMADERKLDSEVVAVLINNYELIYSTRKLAQAQESSEYADFWEMARKNAAVSIAPPNNFPHPPGYSAASA